MSTDQDWTDISGRWTRRPEPGLELIVWKKPDGSFVWERWFEPDKDEPSVTGRELTLEAAKKMAEYYRHVTVRLLKDDALLLQGTLQHEIGRFRDAGNEAMTATLIRVVESLDKAARSDSKLVAPIPIRISCPLSTRECSLRRSITRTPVRPVDTCGGRPW